jgi:CDP-glucose 4,6-dehydratase
LGVGIGSLEGLVEVGEDFGGVFSGRRVLITGHTGFKGSWLTSWLLTLGAEVSGYALEPDTSPSTFIEAHLARRMDSRIGDVRDADAVERLFTDVRPEVVFHLAAQPLVRRSYSEPLLTFATNVMGTVHVLEAARRCVDTRAFINVTTDKVYENPETGHPFREDDPLGGYDPYSASKACSEIVSASYRRSFLTATDGMLLATARAGNVIGGGDWSHDRIAPDIIRALVADESAVVRSPEAVRPWQHVLDPLAGYLRLAASLWAGERPHARAYNFGPESADQRTVRELVERMLASWGEGRWDDASAAHAQPHEAGLLALDNTRARDDLGWRPLWGFEAAVDRTVEWYRRFHEGRSAADLIRDDIEAYTEALRSGPAEGI